MNEIEFEISSKCNLKCPLCVRTHTLTHPEFLNNNLPFDSFTEILTNMPTTKIKFCGVSGDPFANIELEKYIDFAISKNIFIDITTNATLGKIDLWKRLALLGEKNKIKIWLSIDGLEDTNHLYRINAKWNRIEEKLNAIKKFNHNFILKSIVFKHNKHQKIDLENLAKKYNCSISFLPLTKRNSMINELSKNNGEKTNYLLKTEIPNTESFDCMHTNENSIFVDVKGNIWPCFFHYDHYLRFGYKRTDFDFLLNHKNQNRCKHSCGKESKSKWRGT